MNTHEEHIREHYAGKSLSDQRVAEVLSEGERLHGRGVRRYMPIFAMAAVLVLAFLLHDRYLGSRALKDRVLAEIAMNHNKRLGVEVATGRFDFLQSKLDRLDFPISLPDPSLLDTHTLVGGRYCSIQGELAAQLKLRNVHSGEIRTLYITPSTEFLRTIEPQTFIHEGVQIHLWSSPARFFGLAGRN
jgi:hypothetical protein